MAYIIAIGAYLLALMIFGLVVAHKKVKTSDDMVTGGHRIHLHRPGGHPACHLVRRRRGITGSASVVYTGGPWVGLLTFAAPPIGIILLYFIAGKVRKSNKVTVPEIMEARYGQGPPASSPPCASCWPMWVCWPPSSRPRRTSSSCCALPAVWRSPTAWPMTICTVIIAVITVAAAWCPWPTPTPSAPC